MKVLDGVAKAVGDPAAAAEVVGVVEVERGDRVWMVGQRVEVAEHRRGGGERVCGEDLRCALELYGGKRVPRHAGIYPCKAVFAQLGGDAFALGIIMLGVAPAGGLPVGVGHALSAVPAVVLVFHLESVSLVLERERKSTNISGRFLL